MSETVSYYEDSKEIEKKIWDLLSEAVKDRSSEFRTPVFICGNDQDLDGKVIVLRKADQQNNFIQYHSDIRSSKIEKIKKNPKCSILFYGKEEKIQLRVKAECEINYNNDITKESWEKTGHISRKCTVKNRSYGKSNSLYSRANIKRCTVKSYYETYGRFVSWTKWIKNLETISF